jgi:hypothetical protein
VTPTGISLRKRVHGFAQNRLKAQLGDRLRDIGIGPPVDGSYKREDLRGVLIAIRAHTVRES